MNEDLQFTASEYGIASGVFFLSYAIFQASLHALPELYRPCTPDGPCSDSHNGICSQVPSNIVLYSISVAAGYGFRSS